MNRTPDLRTLLERRKPGHSLEAPFYLDPAVFEQDLKLIFGRHWIYAGPEAAVPETRSTTSAAIAARGCATSTRARSATWCARTTSGPTT